MAGRRPVAGLVVGVVMAACGGSPAATTTGSPTTAVTVTLTATSSTTAATTTTAASTTSAPTLEVVKDVEYHHASGWTTNTLDIYHRPDAQGGPVVVLFHGQPAPKDFPLYSEIASALVDRGAVVFVPDWGNPAATAAVTPDPVEARAAQFVEDDAASCAVSYALATAEQYGADPGRLVLFGHSAGSSVTSVVALRTADPFPDCAVSMTPFVAKGMVLWEGDWLLQDPTFDYLGEAIPMMQEAIAPWYWLAAGPRLAVAHFVAAGSIAELTRCGASDPAGWYPLRDPDGWFRDRLEAIGAFDDDCIDVSEPTRVLADEMRAQGYDVTEISLPDSSHTVLRGEDLATLVDEVMRIADR